MDFDLPPDLAGRLAELDRFIEAEIVPLQTRDDNMRFFDHRREWARTDFERDGLPRPEWEALLRESRRLADAKAPALRAAGRLWRARRLQPVDGRDSAALGRQGLGLHADLQTEHSIVANSPIVLMLRDFWHAGAAGRLHSRPVADETLRVTFGLTEPQHGSDATHMETTAVREASRRARRLAHRRREDVDHRHASRLSLHGVRAPFGQRRATRAGSAFPGAGRQSRREDRGIPLDLQHSPTTRRVSFTNGFQDAVPGPSRPGCRRRSTALTRTASARRLPAWGGELLHCRERGLCAHESPARRGAEPGDPVPVGGTRHPGRDAAPAHSCTAWEMDRMPKLEVEHRLRPASMCNYWANRLCCEAADRAMQVHGGIGYSRHKPFEHIYRHHRRYRITEGAEEIQSGAIAGHLFGFLGKPAWNAGRSVGPGGHAARFQPGARRPRSACQRGLHQRQRIVAGSTCTSSPST
ncbi:MAG: acyl-CoA dehydrogenase family protein [Burkholderiaceae bacterium]